MFLAFGIDDFPVWGHDVFFLEFFFFFDGKKEIWRESIEFG